MYVSLFSGPPQPISRVQNRSLHAPVQFGALSFPFLVQWKGHNGWYTLAEVQEFCGSGVDVLDLDAAYGERYLDRREQEPGDFPAEAKYQWRLTREGKQYREPGA